MDIVHLAMRTDLKKLIEKKYYSEARNIFTPNPFLHETDDAEYWKDISNKLCYIHEPLQVSKSTAVMKFNVRDPKEIYPTFLEPVETEKLSVENAKNIITKLSFIAHNFVGIKEILEQKKADEADLKEMEKPNPIWDRYKEVLAKDENELSSVEDDYPFAYVFMLELDSAGAEQKIEPKEPTPRIQTPEKVDKNDALEQELAQELSKRYDQE